MKAVGKSVRLFLVEGTPTGIITAEVVNWTGHLFIAPLSKLPEVLLRSESQKTGVYLLLGEMPVVGGKRPIYVGESDNVGKRISQHARSEERDFERFCLITSKDLNLTKAHARFIENRMSLLAKASDRAEVLNGLEPAVGVLPESDVADMEFFIEQVRLVLPVLGYDVLKDKFVPPAHLGTEVLREVATQVDIVPLHLKASRRGLVAKAVERDGEIFVLSGSLADRFPDFASNQYQALRERLEADGTLVPTEDGQFLKFTSDTRFSSPSAAAAVIYGRNANGRTSWNLANMNKSLKEYQIERQAAV